MREVPLRTRGPKPKVQEDLSAVEATTALFPPPGDAASMFKDGWRECVELFAINRPNRRGVRRILEEHCLTLEDACMRSMSRENVARYEGYRAALKELDRRRAMK